MATYAILGATGNTGTALIQILLQRPKGGIHAYCRNKSKLLKLLPEVESSGRVDIFEDSIHDTELLTSCLTGCRAIFIVLSTNNNIPGCRLSQDTTHAVVNVLQSLKSADGSPVKMPKLILLSSATIDDHFSRHVPYVLRQILLRSASHVYNDLKVTEMFLRTQEDWLTTIYIKPGALSLDIQRGHALSLTEENSPLSYLDLAAAMIEAADDEEGQYDFRNVSVANTNGRAKFPSGTPMVILTGLIRHFFPFMHPYLPTGGP
ncbi:hypothetical protein B0O99DRAFT_80223 [Bisporella sp. PMI_857]|nr:hypothetical protein B0O99DRAFT_80223 [Bisporella sp. PMI_857]